MTFKLSSFFLIVIAFMLGTLSACNELNSQTAINDIPNETSERQPAKPLSSDFKTYWFAGNAEITSYSLEQARYGELRSGTAVLIYVTEPFLAGKQVKADGNSPENISVLKLNATKNFLTGIYPYSIMSSTFYPLADNQHAIKVSSSIQEWCGQVYAQLNNRDSYEVTSHSYFEKEADQNLTLEKTHLENELWNKIRIRPEDLPVGELKVMPSLEYLRLVHQTIRSYDATAKLQNTGDLSTYSLMYPELNRTLTFTFHNSFPFVIEGWTESYPSGFGPNSKMLTTRATKLKTLKTPYWRQNGNEDVSLRDSLGI
ncbi:septum formation inhibitor Maf [Muriicola sp.]|uniref:septum formation inhibitor Maf n=1 Tax=Muriicola sp. TaxID=2020856 RepID=UPI003C7510B1